jgi:CheY-like chemotaxis protein
VDRASHIYAVRAVERMTGLPAAAIWRWVSTVADEGADGDAPAVTREARLFSRDEVEALIAWAANEALERDQRPPAAPPSPAEPSGSPRLLILLAERDRYAAELTEYFLRTEGYRVETVFTVDEAVERFDTGRPDLAIVELLLDGGAGFALARRLADEGRCPVIVVSALDVSAHPEVRGAAAVLTKPLAPLDLVSTVRDLLGTSSLVRGGRA